jgi:RNA polymerase sigma-70 factor (ECF subfamily)
MSMEENERSERLLVARMLLGDDGAFESFFAQHFAPLYRFALKRVSGESEAAEEIVQATLCRAVRKLSTWRGEASLLTWLCAICRNEIATHYQSRRKEPPMVDWTEDIPEIRAAIESLSVQGADHEVRRREIGRTVHAILDRLPPRYGDALEWKYIDGLSVAEIAARLGVAVKAAESLLTRARAAFRDAFSVVQQMEAKS